MGFRSTLISRDYGRELPNWFKEKYSDYILFKPKSMMVSSKYEAKFYDNEFFEDYQKAVTESGFWDEHERWLVIAVLAEDGFITKVSMNKNKIIYKLMYEEMESDHVWQGYF